jgi:hypothetical protein
VGRNGHLQPQQEGNDAGFACSDSAFEQRMLVRCEAAGDASSEDDQQLEQAQ